MKGQHKIVKSYYVGMVLRYYFSSSVGGWTLVEAKLESTLLQLLEELYYRGIIPIFKLQLRTKELDEKLS